MTPRDQERPDVADASDEVSAGAEDGSAKRSGGLRAALRTIGPGVVTGAADDDPSGVATYAQAGATYGMGLLWTVPVSLPLMIVVQEACERMTSASGDSFGALIRRRFARGAGVWIAILLAALLVANGVNAAADLMAIGQGMELVHAGPAPLWSLLAGVIITVVVVRGSFAWISRIFKWLCLALFSYVAVLAVAQVDWGEVLAGLVGARLVMEPGYLGLVVAVLGTTISPYMFFWQSAQEEEMMRSRSEDGDARTQRLSARPAKDARRMLLLGRIDVITGMLFSVAIMFAIIVGTAATLGEEGSPVGTAAEAAAALKPIAGDYAGISSRWGSSAQACSRSLCSPRPAPRGSLRSSASRGAWTASLTGRRRSTRSCCAGLSWRSSSRCWM